MGFHSKDFICNSHGAVIQKNKNFECHFTLQDTSHHVVQILVKTVENASLLEETFIVNAVWNMVVKGVNNAKVEY